MRESFALSNVKEPLLALGKLPRRGWKIEGEGGDARLTHGLFVQQEFAVQAQFIGGGRENSKGWDSRGPACGGE